MKMLWILSLVLGMVTLVSAGLQITVGGQMIDEITIKPSDTIELQIWSDGILTFPGDAYLMTFDGPGSYNADNAYNYHNPGGVNEGYIAVINAEMLFLDFSIIPPHWPYPLNTLMADKILFHCDGEGDVTVTLSALGSYGNVDTDTITIHQIPEPASMLLLGLGGLFLRRK
jgi:hypothetical protein